MKLGLVGLGDTLVPLGPGAVVVACGHAPDQRRGRLEVIRWTERQHPERLWSWTTELRGGRAGSDRLWVRRSVDGGSVEIGRAGAVLLRGESRAETPATPAPALPPEEELRFRGLAIYGQVLVRWFRALLRERAVRVALRDEALALRSLTQNVDEAMLGEDLAVLADTIASLREAAARPAEAVGEAVFPGPEGLLILGD